jgi:hypothetical protein
MKITQDVLAYAAKLNDDALIEAEAGMTEKAPNSGSRAARFIYQRRIHRNRMLCYIGDYDKR